MDLPDLIREAGRIASGAWKRLKRAVALFLAVFVYSVGFPADPRALLPTLYGVPGGLRALWGGRPVGLGGFNAFLTQSLAIHLLRLLESYAVPQGETVIALGPFDAFMAVVYAGLAIAVLVTLPYVVVVSVRYVAPGLTRRERRAARWLGVVAVLSFAAGATLATLLLPPLYAFGYAVNGPAGVAPTVSLNELLGQTLLFVGGIGLAFEVPTLCLGLAYAGTLTTERMRDRRVIATALVGSGAVALVISPGIGGGLIEGPLAGLLFGLFGLSYYLVRGVERARAAREVSSEVRAGA